MSWTSPDDIGIVLPHLTLQAVIGITVSIAGNVLISLALNLQKLAHLRLERERQNGPDTEGEGGPLGRDTNGRHVDASSRFGAAQQRAEDHPFETQPLIPKRSSHQLSPSSYGLPQYNSSITRDDSRSRKSSIAARARLRQRKQPFVSRFLPLGLVLGRDSSSDSSSARANLPDISVEDVFPQRSTRMNHRNNGKAPSSNMAEDETESDYLRSKLWSVIYVLWILIQLVHVGGLALS